jgi:outer membrane lipoprotein SlyB
MPVGAVIYLPLGGETPERPFVGGVGTPEMRERFGETTYEITVRLDDGGMRFIQRNDGSRYQVGDRVRMAGTAGLEPIVE